MSLKGGISATELFNAIDDARKGKKKAIKKLSDHYQKGFLSTEEYNKLLTEYRTNKEKKEKERSQNIKSILSVVILFASMLCGLAYLIDQYGKGAAVWYIFLWLWAISYALST